jgi:hypothetical protein
MARVGFTGETLIDVSAFASTVIVSGPEMPDTVAEMVTVPAPTPVTKPEVETVARLALEEDQVAVVLTFWVDPLLYVAVAVSCRVSPV